MRAFIYITIALFFIKTAAQEDLTYQKPSEEILNLVNMQRAPAVLIDQAKEHMVLLYRNSYKTIKELSEHELRLGGLRINPHTNIGSRINYYTNIKIRTIKDAAEEQVKGLPENPLIANITWAPDQKKIAFTQTTSQGVEIWILDIKKATAKKLTEGIVNANLGDIMNWFEDSASLLVKIISKERTALVDTDNAIPVGPVVSTNDGQKAQNRTYQDLLKNKADEHNFEQLVTSELYKVSLDGTSSKWLGSAMYHKINFSPNGKYVLVSTIEKPFSYLVPYRRFPSKTIIYTRNAKAVTTVLNVPLIENLPKGFMAVRRGKRKLSWRNDQPETLVYVEALDGGDPENKTAYRDEVFELNAPFDGPAKSILKTINRFSEIQWGNANVAIAYDYWWNTRNAKTYVFNPSTISEEPVIISDRNYQNRYNNPGNFVTKRNQMGRNVLALKGNNAFLISEGYTEKGQFPFLDKLNLKTGKKLRLYESEYTEKLETLRQYDIKEDQLLVRIESKSEYPNYYFRHLNSKKLKQISFFKNPFKSIEEIHKEVITYTREDGIELSGTLYLPKRSDAEGRKKMPMILWAYPREYKDKASASQRTQNANRYTYLGWGSPIYWVTKGYVVLDNASFPIFGPDNTQPNDTFITQLVANAKAAIHAVDMLGYIDKDKVAVGGHSYGAFMVANLLTHSDLFAAGIARSGAYNRTLTPFGFQSEERTYWEAPNVYYRMSPFMHADKMKTPLLLIHGEADNNSGTYPLQSIRYFNALKGFGATVRLVLLPKESHGYRAKESILHLLWEQDQWLEKYVKNTPSATNPE